MASSNAQRNIENAKKGYQAFNEGQLAEALETIADDVLWHVGGDGPLAGEYKGKQELGELFMRLGQLTEGTYEADIHDILANDEHVIVLGTSTATRKGRTHSSRFVDIIHPNAHGKAKEFWRFAEDPAADAEFYSE